MSGNFSPVDLVLQYALLITGEQDEWGDRHLGPIHLIKYVYLADLLYAKKHEGITYTGTKWKFYKFGPWAQSVNARIEPALKAIGAEKQSFPSDYEKDEWVRWYLRDEHLLKEKEGELPPAIRLHLGNYIREHGKDTEGLLHFVYNTKPMLSAAPREYLDFSTVVEDAPVENETYTPFMERLSNKKKKEFRGRMRQLREKYKQQRKENKQKYIYPEIKYDKTYYEIIEWLDNLAGHPLPEGKFTVKFSDDVWKSPARKDIDVS